MGPLYHLRKYFLDAPCDDVVGNGVDGCIGVAIDGNDDCAFLHTDGVLYLSADAAGDVEFGAYGEARLPYHAVVTCEASIHGSAGCAHLAVQLLGEGEEQLEALA